MENMMDHIDLVIIAAVSAEIDSLFESIPTEDCVEIAGDPFRVRRVGDLSVLSGATGIGKVNAAATTAALLTRFGPVEVWNIGCAGAYAGSGLCIGDVLITSDSICGDEGVLVNGAGAGMEQIGIPLVTVGGRRYFENFPSEAFSPCRITGIAAKVSGSEGKAPSGPIMRFEASGGPDEDSFTLRYGPALTVSMASGDRETADERFLRHKALAENMEGSAVAQVCLRFGSPFLECRGISNIAGARDKKEWNFNKATANCHTVVRRLLIPG